MKPIKFALDALFALGALALATPAYASNIGSTTQSFGTSTMPSANPCTGAVGTVTITFHDVTHMSFNATGGGAFTETTNGTFSFVPTNPSLPSYTGHFVMWDGGPVSGSGVAVVTATSSIVGRGSDGSQLVFHDVARFTIDFTTNPPTQTVIFDKPTCN